MKTVSPWLVHASFALCAALVIGALSWITRGTMAAERALAVAEIRADVQERTRLALWRMDSLGAALLLDESGWQEEDSRLPVKLRFVVSPAGSLQSPANDPVIEELKQTVGTGANALQKMKKIIREPAAQPPVREVHDNAGAGRGYDQPYQQGQQLDETRQMAANWNEQAVRSKAVQSTLENSYARKWKAAPPAASRDAASAVVPGENAALETRKAARNAPPSAGEARPSQDKLADAIQDMGASTEPVMGQPRVGWVDGLLLLAKRVSDATNETRFHGAWIDEAALRRMLLDETRDLFPDANLTAADGPGADGMVLASFPFRLEVPARFPNSLPLRDSTVASLIMSWAAALVALVAILWLVRGVMRLSERRASFVSAVTHELRTPLTTFRLYSDMLGSGAVKEEKRGEYLQVLSREADRLSHLVENVLAFSRIERGNARSSLREVNVAGLLEESRERLDARLETAGLSLRINDAGDARVRVDTAAIEHILFNLIDNAAKYAVRAEPPVVEIQTRDAGRFIEIHIIDHGPGIPASEHGRIFRAFHKSAREAAESKPGVGLGLALSRRLAREQGGELSCADGAGGRFILRLPRSG